MNNLTLNLAMIALLALVAIALPFVFCIFSIRCG